MKSSIVFERGPLPPYVHLAFTVRHSRDKPSPFFTLFRSVYYTERKPKNKKRGRPGNEASKMAGLKKFASYVKQLCATCQVKWWNGDYMPTYN